MILMPFSGFGIGNYLAVSSGVRNLVVLSQKLSTMIQICLSLLATYIGEKVAMPRHNEYLLYTCGFLKYSILMIVISAVIPYMLVKLFGQSKSGLKKNS